MLAGLLKTKKLSLKGCRDLIKRKNPSHSWIRDLSVKMAILSQLIYSFNTCHLYQKPQLTLLEIDKTIWTSTWGSLMSPRDSQESSPTPQFKSINSLMLSLLYCPILTSIHDYLKNQRTIQTFVSKVMSLLFNMLSGFSISFLPRSKCLSILWLQLPPAVILEPKKIKFATISTYPPSFCHEVMGLGARMLVFWMLSFKPAFLLSFHPHQETP